MKTDMDRLTKLDRMLCDDTGFKVVLQWDNENDVVLITDGLGNVWSESVVDESIEDREDPDGTTLRNAIDSIRKNPIRKCEDNQRHRILVWLYHQMHRDSKELMDRANEACAGCPPHGYDELDKEALVDAGEAVRIADKCTQSALRAMQNTIMNWLADEISKLK